MSARYSIIFIVLATLFLLGVASSQEWNYDSIQVGAPRNIIADSTGENFYLSFYFNNCFWHVDQEGFNNLDYAFIGEEIDYNWGEFFPDIGEHGSILLAAKRQYGDSITDFYLKDPDSNNWEYLEDVSGQSIGLIYFNPDNPNTIVVSYMRSVNVSFDNMESFQTVLLEDYNNHLFPGFFHYENELYTRFDYDIEDETHSKICKWNNEQNDFDYANPVFDTNGIIEGDNFSILKVLPMANGEILISLNGYTDYSIESHLFICNSEWEIILNDYDDFFNGQIIRDIIEDKENPGMLYAQGYRLYRSMDSGRTWSLYSAPGLPQYLSHMNPIYQQYQSGDLYLGIRGIGLLKSTNSGESWTQVDIPGFIGKYEISLQNQHIVLSRGTYPWILYQEGELTSVQIPSTEQETYYMNDFLYMNGDSLFGKVVVDPSPLYEPNQTVLALSTNGGTNWTFLTGERFNTIESHRLENGVRLVKKESLGGPIAFVSYNLGEDWSAIDVPSHIFVQTDNYFFSLAYTDTDVNLVKMPASGGDWEIMDLDLGGHSASLIPYDESLLVVKYEEENVFSCHWWQDESWQQSGSLNINELYPETIFNYNEITYVILMNENGELFLSSDLLNTWQPLEFDFPFETTRPVFHSITYNHHLNQLFVSTEIGLLWVSVEQFLSAEEEPIILQPVDPKLFICYPNPFNASTCIQYNLTLAGNVKLDVYDITGRLVKTLENTYKPAGMQNIFMDGNGLASGTYLIKLDTGTEVRSRRITLVK